VCRRADQRKTWYVVDIRFAPGRKHCIRFQVKLSIHGRRTVDGIAASLGQDGILVLHNIADIQRRN
jgi:hypothetical protein